MVQVSVGVPEAFQIFYATGWQQATVLYRVLPRTGQAPAAAQVCPKTAHPHLSCCAMSWPCFKPGLQAGQHKSESPRFRDDHKKPLWTATWSAIWSDPWLISLWDTACLLLQGRHGPACCLQLWS